MKVIHLIGGGDIGGAKTHVLSLVKELGNHINVKLISFRAGSFADDAMKMGIDVEVISSKNIIKDVKAVIRIIKSGNFDLIHSHGAKANMISVLIKNKLSIPTITTVHSDYRLDYIDNLLKKYSYGLINTKALRLIDYYIGVSSNFSRMLISREFNPNRIFTLYNGLNFDEEMIPYSKSDFIKKYALPINEDTLLIGILARPHPIKGINIFLNAANLVLEKHPNVHFLIGGDGEERKLLERQIHALGIKNNVHFLGFINDPYEFMSNIDINILSSLSESFPYVILEACKLKKPVISSNVGGISDLIDNGVNSFLFTPGNFTELSEKMISLLEDSNKRARMGELIYEKATTYFSLKSMCKSQLEIYSLAHRCFKNNLNFNKNHNDVLISGYYGFKNIGDEAMLLAIIENLKSLDDTINITVLSKNSTITKLEFGVNSIYRLNLFGIIKSMRNSKLFINGGGNLIQDNTSSRSLLYYLSIIVFAKILGLKTMLYANGIGPVNSKFDKWITKKVLNTVDTISLRETVSIEALKLLNIIKPTIVLSADPALTILPSSENEIINILTDEKIDLKKPLLGVCVRNWRTSYEYYLVIARALDYASTKYNLTPVFIPMQFPKDYHISNIISTKMQQKSYIIKGKYSISQIIGIISHTQIMISMRLHGLIFSLIRSIPSIGLVYEVKVKAFLDYTSQPSAGDIDVLDYDEMIKIIDKTWENREQIQKELAFISSDLKEKALLSAKHAVALIKDKAKEKL